MIRKLVFLAGCFTLLLQYVGTAVAGPLTEQQVERYLNSMPQAQVLSQKHDDGKRKPIDPQRPLSSALELMNKQGPAYNDLGKLAAEYGFSSTEEWANVGDRVMNGYLFLKLGMSAEQIEQAYQQGVSNIKKAPTLSEAQKQKILQGMEKSHASNRNRRINAQPDMPALAPYQEALKKAYEQ
ncbi:hypothetical protein H0A66_13180 [Alcaligenaceae bacterium]|nr:hypothetical protein [Alcaligenaceae bacterium]